MYKDDVGLMASLKDLRLAMTLTSDQVLK